VVVGLLFPSCSHRFSRCCTASTSFFLLSSIDSELVELGSVVAVVIVVVGVVIEEFCKLELEEEVVEGDWKSVDADADADVNWFGVDNKTACFSCFCK